MKSVSCVAPLTLALGLTFTLNAQAAPSPCTVYLCMAGISGVGLTGGPDCVIPIAYWHAPFPAGLAVYSPNFNPPASRTRRRNYLDSCPGANHLTNGGIKNAIVEAWGSIP